ncbi:hypothetical protein [Pseudomonas sp. RIT-PI-AD]|nr:hypothetical protein [Pseudomonas sp. RIT-PI-AD]
MKPISKETIVDLVRALIEAGAYLPDQLIRQPFRQGGVWTAVIRDAA